MITAVELGLIYAVMALGVYLTFRILNFPDLTVDGSFTTGAAVASISIVNGMNPFLATALAFLIGAVAGVITGLLHTKGKIDGLLAGILTMIALYSINLRIMGKANVPLLGEDTLISPLRTAGILGTWTSVALMFLGCLVAVAIVVWFLHTQLGMAMRATGDNEEMIRSFGVSTDNQKILGLAISNGFVGLSGALIAQFQGFADIGMGIGLILIGLASVIVGQAIFSQRWIWLAALAVVLGAVIYRLVIQFALMAGLEVNDMKLISAVLVVVALLLPKWKGFQKLVRMFKRPEKTEIVDTTKDAQVGSNA
ncbi:ABC transporter permease [Glutamicibacter uratoxydans]|uniref:ABC transporter permease n=1 Tax=Glutamicibacter uratoxydans TaxID=43667 RepID=UPI003D6EEE57